MRFTPIPIPTTTFLSVLPRCPQTSKPVSPEGLVGPALGAEWTPSPWYMLLKHMSFSSGITPAARLVDPSSRILSSSSLTPVSDIPIMVSTVKYLCYFLTRDFQMGIHFLILEFYVRPMA